MNYFILLVTAFCSISLGAVTLKDHHLVLVGGLNNELVPTYFRSFEKILRQKDVKNIHRILPTSYQTVMENVSPLKAELERLYRVGNSRPMIIVAHSKGGLELMHVMIRHFRDFFPEKVKYLIFANVPFQGSPFMKIAIKKLESPIYAYNPVVQAQLRAMRSLETDVISFDLEKSFALLTASERKELSERVLYLRTSEEASQVHFSLNESAAYLRSTQNDGLIPLSNQRLNNFGNDLSVESSTDHTDLFVSLADDRRSQQLNRIIGLIEAR